MCGCEEKGERAGSGFLNIKFLDVSSRLFPLHVLFMETTPLTPGSIFLIKFIILLTCIGVSCSVLFRSRLLQVT